MTFAEALAAVPLTTRGPDPVGFLPPILRAQGHMALVLAVVADEEDTSMTDEQLFEELEHARLHWGAINATENVSTTARQSITNIGDLFNGLHDEWAAWERDDRVKNLRDVANRVVGFGAALDRELVGLADSDAGTQL